MGAASLQGSLLLMAFTIHTVLTAPVIDDTALLGPDQIAEGNGCYYNYDHYEEGDRILTNEPCLNCTCHNRMLMCYLRVCPFTKAIGQDCKVEKKPDQCCPVITCPQVHVALLTSSTTETASPSTALGHPDNFGCVLDDNTFYADGAQVPSDPKKPCELCYCIRNQTACVMQECTLNVEGCKPVYQEGVCCPVRYDCDYDEVSTTTPSGLVTTPGGPNECLSNGKVFFDGELIDNLTDKPCEHCYCMRGEIVCAVQDCGTPLENTECTPLEPEPGQCCPSTYQCPNGTVPANILKEKPQPSIDSLSITEKPADEDNASGTYKPAAEAAAGTESPSSGSADEEQQPEIVDQTSEGEKADAVIEIITTAAPSEALAEEQSPSEQLQEHNPEEAHEASTDPEPVEQDHFQVTHPDHDEVQQGQESETTSPPYTEISVENVEMNTSPPEITKPDQPTHDAEPSENTAEPEMLEATTAVPFVVGAQILDASHLEEAKDPEISSSQPEEPENPSSQPEEPENPPSKPEEPENPPSQPEEPENPPSQPEEPENSPSQTEESAISPHQPEQPEKSHIQTEAPESSEAASQPEVPEMPDAPSQPQETSAPIFQDVQETVAPPTTTSTTEAQPEPEEMARIPGEGSCLHLGITYAPNTEVPSANSCKRCRCINSIVTCSDIECPEPPLSLYTNCIPMPPTDDACCPTYFCEQKPSAEPEAENQMSIDKIDQEVHEDEAVDSITTAAPLHEEEPVTADPESLAVHSHDEAPTDAHADATEAAENQPESAESAETETQAPIDVVPPQQVDEPSQPLVEGDATLLKEPEHTDVPEEPQQSGESEVSHSPAEQHDPEQTPNAEGSAEVPPEVHEEYQAPIDLTTAPPAETSDNEASPTALADPVEPVAAGTEKDQPEAHGDDNEFSGVAPTTIAPEIGLNEKQEETHPGEQSFDEEIKPTTASEGNPPATETPEEQSGSETPAIGGNIHSDVTGTSSAEGMPAHELESGEATEHPGTVESDAPDMESQHDVNAPLVELSQNENDRTVETTVAPAHEDHPSESSENEATSGEVTSEPGHHSEDESATSDGSNVSAEVGTEPSVAASGENEGAEHDSVPSESGQEPGSAQDVSESEVNESDNVSHAADTATSSPEIATSAPEQMPTTPESSGSSSSNQDVLQTEGPIEAPESPEELQPMVTSGPPVLFPDIGHQGAPIQIPGPAGISEPEGSETMDGNSERFGETEAPASEVQTEATTGEEGSQFVDKNDASEIPQTHADLPITTEGPSSVSTEKEETNEINASTEGGSSDNQISESSHGNEANEISPESVPSSPEQTPSESAEPAPVVPQESETPEAVGPASEAAPLPEEVSYDSESPSNPPIETHSSEVTEPSQASPEESAQPQESSASPESSEKIIPTATEAEGQSEGQNEAATAVPVVTHGELPSSSESDMEPVENVVVPEGEVEEEKHPEIPETQFQPEVIPPSAPEAANQPDAVTQAPENDEVVTHIDSAGPPKTPEIANQVVEVDINAIEHSTAEQEHPVEDDNIESEKTVPAPVDQPVASEQPPAPAAPEQEVESQPEQVEPERMPEETPAEPVQVPEAEEEAHSVPSPSLETHPEESSSEVEPDQPLSVPEADKPIDRQEIPQTTEGQHADVLPVKQPEETGDEAKPSEIDQSTETSSAASYDEVNPMEHDPDVPVEQTPEHVEQPLEEHDEQEPHKAAESVEPVPEEAVEQVPGEPIDVSAGNDVPAPEQVPAEPHAESSLPDVISQEQVETTPETAAGPEAPQVDQAEPAPEHSQTLDLMEQHSILDGEPQGETTPKPSEPAVTGDNADAQPSTEIPTSSVHSEDAEQIESHHVGSEKVGSDEPSTAAVNEVPQATDAPMAAPENESSNSESHPSVSEPDLSVPESAPTAGEELTDETAPSAPTAPETAPESAPSAPEYIPLQPTALEEIPEQPSAHVSSQPSEVGEVSSEGPSAFEAVAEPEHPSAPEVPSGPETSQGDGEPVSHEEQVPSQPESSQMETEKEQPVPESPNSQLTELAHSSQAPPPQVPTTEGPAMAPGLQNWSPKPAYPQTHPEVPHLPEDSHYPSPPYDQDYEDEDSISYGPGTCRYGGKVYLSAQQIPRDDPCDFCFCFRSDIICLQQSCPPPIKGCYQETIKGFCCPRYECHVSMATMVNITTTSTTTTTTVPPHFMSHHYNGSATKAGCQVKGIAYRVGDRIPSTSGPCLDCRCGADGQMKCDPTNCGPQESLLRQVMAASIAKRRR